MKGFIISGAGGFIGRNILSTIGGKLPVLAVSSDAAKLKAFAGTPSLDVLSNEDFFNKKLDLSGYVLIHLAYVRSHDFPVMKASLDFTRELLEKAQAAGITQVVHISSQSVYDDKREHPAKETDLVIPTNLYDIGKYYLENWIRDFSSVHNIKYINLRIASLVGRGFEQRITTRLIKNGLAEGRITINRNGKVFSYTHVSDIVQGILAAVRIPEEAWNRTYNVGTSESYTLEGIADAIAREFESRKLTLTVERIPTEQNLENSSLDSSAFQKAAGWTAEMSLADIVREETGFQLEQGEAGRCIRN